MKKNILFLHCTQDYGYQFSAANSKIELLSKGFSALFCDCYINNGIVGSSFIKKSEYLHKPGIGSIITYPRKYNQIVSPFFNLIHLYHDMKRNRLDDNDNFVFLELPDYHIFLIYVFLSKILRYKVIIIAHEWATTLGTTHFLRVPSNWIYSKSFGYFADAILPISEYIITRIRHFNKPFIKLPVLSDFNRDKIITVDSPKGGYFLYCVYSAYKSVIFFIIDSFVKYIYDHSPANINKLVLVLSGSSQQIKIIEEYIIDNNLNDYIQIRSKLSYDDLFLLYSRSNALIIPLDPNNEQDKARFSQKIAEYLSSSTPIITNKVGEIKYYFVPGYDVVTADDYSIEAFSGIFKWADDNIDKLLIIGANGFTTGKNNFDYATNCKLLIEFLKPI